MIIERGTIRVDDGIEYVTQWIDNNGNYVFDRFLTYGKLIVNKKVTGCGFTTYCLSNQENTILVSPRTMLIRDKIEQFNSKIPKLFYFNREKGKRKKQKEVSQLAIEFDQYRQSCIKGQRPLKILVTYDSFASLAMMLEQQFGYEISCDFRIAIDESHTIIKDVKIKEYSNKCVLSSFLQCLFQYEKLLFISATPIIDYIRQIPQFMAYNIDYIELDWPNIAPINIVSKGCKNPTDAFDQIFKDYQEHQDQYNRHYFDAIHYGGGHSEYSYEGVIFLNSVVDIRRIVNKYVNKLHAIDISDITVICADNDENAAALHKTNPGLNIAASIPKRGKRHKTWTFVTRTAFEGVDFYSLCASTFVIANYHVDSLSLDIASDIPQIIGRQRVKENLFRNTLHIFYTNFLSFIDDDEFNEYREKKMEISRQQIGLWNSLESSYKPLGLTNLTSTIEKYPNAMYVKTVNGLPEIDNLIILSEDYCRDIVKNQISWYSIMSPNNADRQYSLPVMELRDQLNNVGSSKKSQERVKLVLEGFMCCPECQDDIFSMLHNEGYNDIASYFNLLPPNRILANGCDPWKIEREIELVIFKKGNVKDEVALRFVSGQVYSKKEVKVILQDIYDCAGLKKKAKSTDLEDYVDFSITKKNGLKAYRIINSK